MSLPLPSKAMSCVCCVLLCGLCALQPAVVIVSLCPERIEAKLGATCRLMDRPPEIDLTAFADLPPQATEAPRTYNSHYPLRAIYGHRPHPPKERLLFSSKAAVHPFTPSSCPSGRSKPHGHDALNKSNADYRTGGHCIPLPPPPPRKANPQLSQPPPPPQ